MFYLEAILRAILVLKGDGKVTAWCKLLETSQRDTVVFLYLIIIILVAESKRKHTLLLQIGLVDTGEALGKNHLHIEESRFHRSMFTRRALTIVIFCHYDAADILSFISLGSSRNLHVFAIQLVFHLVALTIESIHGTHQEVVGDILQMTTELQPRTCHRDMVCCTLTLCLDQQRHIHQILTIPGSKRSEFLESVAIRSNHHLNVGIFLAWSNKALIFYGKSLRRESKTGRSIEHHAVAILI